MSKPIKATATADFLGVRDGMVMPDQIRPGDVIEGRLAEAVIAAGWAIEITDEVSPTPEPAEPAKDNAPAKGGK